MADYVPGDVQVPPPLYKAAVDLLDLFARLLPEGYLGPLRDPGPGYEVLQAFAALLSRVSLAVGRLDRGLYVLQAPSAAQSTGQVELYRPTASAVRVRGDLDPLTFSLPVLGVQTISGAAAFSSVTVGSYITVVGTSFNDGSWPVVAVGSGSVQVTNPGGAAEGPVTVQWEERYAVTVLAGTRLSTSRGGRDFLTTADAVFGPTSLGPVTVGVIAVAPGYEYDVQGTSITPDGEVLAGEIDKVTVPLQSPAFGDPTIQVRQIVATSGGTDGFLEQLGEDRGISREPSEMESRYRARVRSLPDTISLDAVDRVLNDLLSPMGIPYDIIETWEQRYQTCWLGSDDAPGSIPTTWGFSSDLFVYDDPRTVPPFYNRWLSEHDYRGAFIVVLPLLAAFRDLGMAWDDSAGSIAAHATVYGRRAHSYFDGTASDNPGILPGGYDGWDIDQAALWRAVWNLLQQTKAGGIDVALEREGS